jgi:NAD(P)-dependent dehydrogenase (short-subunit alcohol dehydrogenase family)
MYPDLRGKKVVVTGANQGLGRGVAEAFLDAGSEVVAMVRSPMAWAEDIASDRLEVLECDIHDLDKASKWLRALEQQGRKVDVLVNNAGVLAKGDLMECTPEDWDHMFGVNVRATFFLSQLLARHMKQQGGGVIVNAGSYAATLPSVSHAGYAASKAALVSLTRGMAAEWAPFDIRVNAFSPGVVPTRMTRPALALHEEKMVNDIALHRVGTTQEVANVVLFLASDVSSYMTGVDVDVSGGKFIVQNPGAAWS